MKIRLSSQNRWRATASERRLHGGATVTEFFAIRSDDENTPSRWLRVKGYGPTPGERKTYAKKTAERIFAERDEQERKAS
jgi:hypothetical protein